MVRCPMAYMEIRNIMQPGTEVVTTDKNMAAEARIATLKNEYMDASISFISHGSPPLNLTISIRITSIIRIFIKTVIIIPRYFPSIYSYLFIGLTMINVSVLSSVVSKNCTVMERTDVKN